MFNIRGLAFCPFPLERQKARPDPDLGPDRALCLRCHQAQFTRAQRGQVAQAQRDQQRQPESDR